MADDICLNKTAVIRRCLTRVREEFRGDPTRLEDFTIQDSIVLNLQRACEASIDLAMHWVAERKLGTPQSSREAFGLLASAGALPQETAKLLQRMVGFRNIAVHDYQQIQLPILRSIIEHHLGDFEALIEAAITVL